MKMLLEKMVIKAARDLNTNQRVDSEDGIARARGERGRGWGSYLWNCLG